MNDPIETRLREAMAERGRALMQAGMTPGTSGNISCRVGDNLLITPTNSRLGELDPADISKIDAAGRLLSGKKPSKEADLHRSMLRQRPTDTVVVHLHSPHSVALACLDGLPQDDLLPPITAYYVMKVGKLPLVPYFPPGSAELARAITDFARDHHAVLLANHGPVIAGRTLDEAVAAAEELELTARLYFILQGQKVRVLTDAQVAELADRGGNQ